MRVDCSERFFLITEFSEVSFTQSRRESRVGRMELNVRPGTQKRVGTDVAGEKVGSTLDPASAGSTSTIAV